MYIPPPAGATAQANGVFAYILREASALFARSTIPGNAKASESGAGNKYGSHVFYVNFQIFLGFFFVLGGRELIFQSVTVEFI